MAEANLIATPLSRVRKLEIETTNNKGEVAEVNAFKFQRTVLQYKDKLYRFAWSYLNNDEDAKDVVQEVLIKAWEALKAGQVINNIEAWCMTATKNKSLDRMKRKDYRNLNIDDQYETKNEDPDPLKTTMDHDIKDRIMDLVAALPENQRNVVRLKDVEGYSNPEIAEILNMEPGQVRVTLHRARAILREKLSKIETYGLQQHG